MTIYGIFKDNKLVYIGQTRLETKLRMQHHFGTARRGKDNGMPIIRAIIKYGKSRFSWEIIKHCKSLPELNIMEMGYIKKYKPIYNIATGGVNGLGHSKETKLKISNFQKKKILCISDQICFFSVQEAEAFYKAGKGTIGRVAAGKRNFYKGKKFEFIKNNTPKD